MLFFIVQFNQNCFFQAMDQEKKAENIEVHFSESEDEEILNGSHYYNKYHD